MSCNKRIKVLCLLERISFMACLGVLN